jgi:hypothetical protein
MLCADRGSRMSVEKIAFLWPWVVLAGCSPTSGTLAPDAGVGPTIPPTAYSECDGAAVEDASAFVKTASCTLPPDDAGTVTACEDWSMSPDGDWSSFILFCAGVKGVLRDTACPAAGLVGTCALPANCTNETTVSSYGGGGTTSLAASCAAAGGSWASAR